MTFPRRRLGGLCRIVNGGTPTAEPENWDGDVPFVTPPDLRGLDGKELATTERSLTEHGAQTGSATVPSGVLLSTRAPIGYVGIAGRRVAFNQGCRGLILAEGDLRYLAYALVASRLELGARGQGTTFMEVSSSGLADLAIPWPSIERQRAIADFLDREAAKIDALIAKQTSLMDMLLEREQDEVDTAVVESARDARPLKLSWLFAFLNGDRGASYPSREDFISKGVPFINAGHLSEGRVQRNGMNYITSDQFSQMGGAKLRPGDVLFCLRGSLGKFGVFDWHGWTGALASSLVALRRISTQVDIDYFSLVLRSTQFSEQVRLAQSGSAQPNLAVEDLRQFRIDLPPIATQRAIAATLAEQYARTVKLRDLAAGHIALAQERRSALITAAVTGQLEIPTA